MIVTNVPLWSVTIWDKKYNAVEKEWQSQTKRYKYLLSDELDRICVEGGSVRLLYTGKDIGYTTEELAGDALAEGEIVAIPWGGTPSVKYYHGKFVTGDNRIATSSKPDELLNKYLYYYLLGHLNEIASYYRGAGLKHPSMRDVLKMNISYPAIDEQKRIISLLDMIEDLISKRKQQIVSFDELVKSRFIELFGDPVTNPMGWPVSELSEYISFLTSGSRGWARYFSDSGEYFITIKNVKNCRIAIDDVQYVVPPDNAEAKRTKVQEGDLLISITADLGRTGVVTKEIADYGGYINQHLTCIRLDRDAVRPLYVAYYMESDAGKRQFQAKNQSAVKAGLNFNSINALRLAVPPIELQDAFISFVEQTDKSKLAVQKALEELEILKKSLMQQYFG